MIRTFREDFSSDRIDAERWRTNYPWGSRIHNYNGYASSSNVWLHDGTLHITAENEPTEGQSYTTGVASPRRTFGPGYIEARVKVPEPAPGLWPALWLTPVTHWPPEIDIFEFFGADTRAWMSYHYRDSSRDHQRATSSYGGTDFGDDFHRFAVDWSADRIIWYIDDVERFRYDGPHVTDDDMHLIFNFGIDPDFLASPRSEDLPANLEMQWIRAWERSDEQTTTTRPTDEQTTTTRPTDEPSTE